ncbi:MAG: phosphatidylglycerophosphatase A [Candidatus Marinimicrobia bacterium]|nr:phosphatidylglycerophosphatase A [Candidatus Neomarinimicrobiota bacterium]
MTIWRFAATFFYLGKIPLAPGSCGSLGTLVLWLFLPITASVHFSVILILFVLGVYSSHKVAKYLKVHDPSEIVIDEAVGMGISLFMLPHNLVLYLFAFLLFRFFDILKPSFIYQAQNLPGGWGIMLDDVLAGLFTLAIVSGIAFIL